MKVATGNVNICGSFVGRFLVQVLPGVDKYVLKRFLLKTLPNFETSGSRKKYDLFAKGRFIYQIMTPIYSEPKGGRGVTIFNI